MKILIINGPNLNLLGKRNPSLYGTESFDDFFKTLCAMFPEDKLDMFQSNIEGEIIDALQRADSTYDGIALNAGGYTHTSVSIADTVEAISIPVVEVHISSILARESFRQISLIAPHAIGSIMGFGLKSYTLAIKSLK